MGKSSEKISRLFDYIVWFKRNHDGNSPGMREMAEYMNTSTSVINYYLDKMTVAGMIKPRPFNHKRFIEVVGGTWVYPFEQVEAYDNQDDPEMQVVLQQLQSA